MTLSLEALLWLSLFAAPLGCFLIFRRLSYYGDALSHSTLAGIAAAYFLVGSEVWALALGALLAAVIGGILMSFFERLWKIPTDLALTVSAFGLFALGLYLSEGGTSHGRVDLEHILVGDLSRISEGAVKALRFWGSLVLLVVLIFWKQLWASVIDPTFAQIRGVRTKWMDYLLISFVGISVVGIMQAVGIVLVGTFLVIPAGAILPWARSLPQFFGFTILFALLASLGSMGWSSRADDLTVSGPQLALTFFLLFGLSYLLHWALKFFVPQR